MRKNALGTPGWKKKSSGTNRSLLPAAWLTLEGKQKYQCWQLSGWISTTKPQKAKCKIFPSKPWRVPILPVASCVSGVQKRKISQNSDQRETCPDTVEGNKGHPQDSNLDGTLEKCSGKSHNHNLSRRLQSRQSRKRRSKAGQIRLFVPVPGLRLGVSIHPNWKWMFVHSPKNGRISFHQPSEK